MITKELWNNRVDTMNQKLMNLYQSGSLNLKSLYEMRDIVKDMDTLMQRLFSDTRYFLGSSKVKKDLLRLNNEYLIFEYNLSLISSSVA